MAKKSNSWFGGTFRATDPTPPKPPPQIQFYLSIQQIGAAEPTIYLVNDADLRTFFDQFKANWESNAPVMLVFGENGGLYHPRNISITWERVNDVAN